jgi:hypothetical protein
MRARLLICASVAAAVLASALVGGASAAPQPCSSGVGQEATGPCKRAKAAAARTAAAEYGFEQPAIQWSTACYPQSGRKYECTVHSGGSPPRCTGGVIVIKRDGRWRARDVELACRRA